MYMPPSEAAAAPRYFEIGQRVANQIMVYTFSSNLVPPFVDYAKTLLRERSWQSMTRQAPGGRTT